MENGNTVTRSALKVVYTGVYDGTKTRKFSSLAALQQYVKSRWEGAEYIDTPREFHNDYGRFTLYGCALKDLGHRNGAAGTDGYWDWTWNEIDPPAPEPGPEAPPEPGIGPCGYIGYTTTGRRSRRLDQYLIPYSTPDSKGWAIVWDSQMFCTIHKTFSSAARELKRLRKFRKEGVI